jgi:hypothetical protein
MSLFGFARTLPTRTIFREIFQDLTRKVDRGLDAATTFTGQTLLDGVSAVSSVQVRLGLEPPARRLAGAEIGELRKIFGDSVDYDAVRIKQGNAGVFSVNDRAFTSGNTIYMKDFRDDPWTTDRLEQMPALVSEMTHVWQYQNGGAGYASRALLSQRYGAGYDFARSVPHTPWGGLGPEQQDALLNAAYKARAFDHDPPVFWYDLGGDGNWEDLSGYLRDALADIRAGRGAA